MQQVNCKAEYRLNMKRKKSLIFNEGLCIGICVGMVPLSAGRPSRSQSFRVDTPFLLPPWIFRGLVADQRLP
jgi:hypothetical protein